MLDGDSENELGEYFKGSYQALSDGEHKYGLPIMSIIYNNNLSVMKTDILSMILYSCIYNKEIMHQNDIIDNFGVTIFMLRGLERLEVIDIVEGGIIPKLKQRYIAQCRYKKQRRRDDVEEDE